MKTNISNRLIQTLNVIGGDLDQTAFVVAVASNTDDLSTPCSIRLGLDTPKENKLQPYESKRPSDIIDTNSIRCNSIFTNPNKTIKQEFITHFYNSGLSNEVLNFIYESSKEQLNYAENRLTRFVLYAESLLELFKLLETEHIKSKRFKYTVKTFAERNISNLESIKTDVLYGKYEFKLETSLNMALAIKASKEKYLYVPLVELERRLLKKYPEMLETANRHRLKADLLHAIDKTCHWQEGIADIIYTTAMNDLSTYGQDNDFSKILLMIKYVKFSEKATHLFRDTHI